MSKFVDKIRKFWFFRLANPVVRKGESKDGAFKWRFRRFWLEIETLSGNFKARFTAGEHPYGYLLAGKSDDNIEGFCQCVYMISSLLTTDQSFVKDVQKALNACIERKENEAKIVEDETEEKIALETEKEIQKHIELPKKERRKVERDINGRFKKAVKEVEKHEAENR